MSGVTGDFGALDRLVRGVGELATARFRGVVLEAAKPVLSALVQAEFQLSTGPRGVKWKRLKYPRARGRANKGGPLYASGELREQASSPVVLGDALVIIVNHPGALVHLYGSKGRGAGARDTRGRFVSAGRIPARPYLPLKTLPPRWLAGLNTAASAALRVQLR